MRRTLIQCFLLIFGHLLTTQGDIVPPWAQCGGMTTCNTECVDNVWPNTTCPELHECQRIDEFYWRCVNSAAYNSSSGLAHNRMVPAEKFKSGEYNYGKVIDLAFMFYEAQRVGKLPPKTRIPWRSDAFLHDKSPANTDISGGWLDAGDNVRFNFPMSWSAGVVAWSLHMFAPAYQKAGHYQKGLSNIRWVASYLIRCFYAPDNIVAQVGNGAVDHARWTRPEYIKDPNPVFTLSPTMPGSDLAGSTAGMLAWTSSLFKTRDRKFAKRALTYARKYYEFGIQYRGKYSDSVPDAASFYPSQNYYDDLAWGALSLYAVTKETRYLTDAKGLMQAHWDLEGTPWKNYDWDSHGWGARVLLAKYAPEMVRAREEIDDFARTWVASNGDGFNGPKFTPKGLAWFTQWGSLRHASNAAFLVLAHVHNNVRNPVVQKRMVCFAHKQLRYMLGESGRSYVVGYGTNPPQRPHHRASSCPVIPAACGWDDFNNPAPNPSVLYGALVGGPDINDQYQDVRSDYISNEVATDYNAGFVGALAGLVGAKWKHHQC